MLLTLAGDLPLHQQRASEAQGNAYSGLNSHLFSSRKQWKEGDLPLNGQGCCVWLSNFIFNIFK